MGYTYVMSDIHGMYEAYLKMLKKIKLSKEDHLYILGDVIDRGRDGIKIIKDIMERENTTMILGNHEAMMLDVITLGDFEGSEYRSAITRWQKNGGGVTAHHYFSSLNYKEQAQIITFLEGCALFLTIDVLGKKYHLVHAYPDITGIADAITDKVVTFNSLKKLSIEEATSLVHMVLWKRVAPNDDFSDFPMVILGHTPTIYYQKDIPMKFWHGNHMINIDCGCSYLASEKQEGVLGCLRLEDMKEYYVK